jgi:hypothetical protein
MLDDTTYIFNYYSIPKIEGRMSGNNHINGYYLGYNHAHKGGFNLTLSEFNSMLGCITWSFV